MINFKLRNLDCTRKFIGTLVHNKCIQVVYCMGSLRHVGSPQFKNQKYQL